MRFPRVRQVVKSNAYRALSVCPFAFLVPQPLISVLSTCHVRSYKGGVLFAEAARACPPLALALSRAKAKQKGFRSLINIKYINIFRFHLHLYYLGKKKSHKNQSSCFMHWNSLLSSQISFLIVSVAFLGVTWLISAYYSPALTVCAYYSGTLPWLQWLFFRYMLTSF